MRRLVVLGVAFVFVLGVAVAARGEVFKQGERGSQRSPSGMQQAVTSSGEQPLVSEQPARVMPRERRAATPGSSEYYRGPEPLPPGQRPPSSVRPPSNTPPSFYRRPLPPPGDLKRPPRVSSKPPSSWPIKRPPRPVIVYRWHDRDRIAARLFLPLVIFPWFTFEERRGYYGYGRYDRERLTWSDSVYLYGEEGWVEFVLDCNAWGQRLWIEVRDGRADLDWAEVVFGNGESQVIDFSDRSLGPGLYPLLDFRNSRRVDHVRMVAQAATYEVGIILRMEQ